MVDNKIKHFLISAAVTFIIISTLCVLCMYRVDITQATYNDLVKIDGIGDKLACEILEHLKYTDDIDSLIEIDGIGPVKLKALKGVFR